MTTERIDPGLGTPAYLGNKQQEYGGLDTFPNPGVSIIRMTSDEVTSECPITGQPDFEVVDLSFGPDKLGIESKSWKLFLQTFRHKAAFVEQLARTIADEVIEYAHPQWVRVDVTQKARGGVSIVATCHMVRDGSGVYHVSGLSPNPPRNFYLGH